MNDPASTRTEAKDAHLIATWVRLIRPDWDTPGVIAALRKRADNNPARLALAALACAADRTNRYPNVIAMDGSHWRVGEIDTPADRHPSHVTVDQMCTECSKPPRQHPWPGCAKHSRSHEPAPNIYDLLDAARSAAAAGARTRTDHYKRNDDGTFTRTGYTPARNPYRPTDAQKGQEPK
jgi:hypothetical protein